MSSEQLPSMTEESDRGGGDPPLVYRSDEILQGRREILIEHAGQIYRLRLTSAHKLYLTK